MRWRPLQIQMLEERENNERERGNTGESFEWCTTSPSSWWWMRHRWKQKTSFLVSRRSPHQSLSSQRRPGPPVRSAKKERGLWYRVSTPLPPMSTNALLHAWHKLLKQDCLYFWPRCSPGSAFLTSFILLSAMFVWHCAVECDGEQVPGWLPQSSKDGSDLFSSNKHLQTNQKMFQTSGPGGKLDGMSSEFNSLKNCCEGGGVTELWSIYY